MHLYYCVKGKCLKRKILEEHEKLDLEGTLNMEGKIIDNFKMYYCKISNGSDCIETFSDIEGYKKLIQCIDEYILMLKDDQTAKYTIVFKGKYDRKSTLNFIFKNSGELDTYSLTYQKTHNVENFNVYANINMYNYLKKRLIELIVDLKETKIAELNFFSGIDVDPDSPHFSFFHIL